MQTADDMYDRDKSLEIISQRLKKPIAIIFANLKGNIGDFAILHAMLQEIAERYPEHPLHVFSHPLVGIDEARLVEFKKNSPAFELVGTTFFKTIPWILKILTPPGLWPIVQTRFIESLSSQTKSDAAFFSEYEAVFVAGGDQWSGKELGISMFGTITAIHKHNKNIYAFPFSVKSSILKLYSKEALKHYLERLRSPLIVRDGISKSIIDQLNLRSLHGVDCVYSIQDLAHNIHPKNNRNQSRTLFVVKGKPKDLEQSLRRLLPGTPDIELLSTCAPEDGMVYERLAEKFGLPYHAPASWQDAVSELKASSLIITNRLHCLILASFAEVPILPVTNRKKSLAFVKDAGIPHSSPSAIDISSTLIKKAKTDRHTILEKMIRYRDRSRMEPHSPITIGMGESDA